MVKGDRWDGGGKSAKLPDSCRSRDLDMHHMAFSLGTTATRSLSVIYCLLPSFYENGHSTAKQRMRFMYCVHVFEKGLGIGAGDQIQQQSSNLRLERHFVHEA